MKTFKTTAVVVAMFLMSLTAFSQKRVFNEFAGNKDITTVYISPAAMRLGLNLGADGSSEMDKIRNCIKNPQGMEIVTSESGKAAETIRKSAEKKIESLGMELLMNTTEGDEKVNIYVGKMLDDSVMRDILIEVSENKEYSLIYIKGDIDIEMLTETVKKKQ